MASTGFSWLLCICIVQFLIIISLINKKYGGHHESPGKSSLMNAHLPVKQGNNLPLGSAASVMPVLLNSAGRNSESVSIAPRGVAATLLLHAPTWFQRRYTMMIQNAVNNIPSDWVVQIFYTTSGQSQHGLDISPGIKHFIAEGKVILTPIPSRVLTTKKKRFEMMFEPWVWENILADTVLIFGGNSVICSNSPHTFANFSQFDYIGAPWDFKRGVGGDGGISIRSKSAMLAAIDFALSTVPSEKKDSAFKTWGQEDQFYVRTLLEMNEKGMLRDNKELWRIASREETLRFAAIGGAVNPDVLVVSGTLPSVSYDERQSFINVCPEIKMFYPALHDPHCFGAQPDAEGCAKSICALKDKKDRKGGC